MTNREQLIKALSDAKKNNLSIGECWILMYAAADMLEADGVPLTDIERQELIELLDKEGHDGTDFEAECPLCTAREKLAAHGITENKP